MEEDPVVEDEALQQGLRTTILQLPPPIRRDLLAVVAAAETRGMSSTHPGTLEEEV